jgi:sporulation protein YlmC with PRC-barrel domain
MPTVSGHTSAIRAGKAIGTNVYDGTGKKIGEVKDIVLEKTSNNILFAVVGFGGVLGMGEKYHPVPWSELDRLQGHLRVRHLEARHRYDVCQADGRPLQERRKGDFPGQWLASGCRQPLRQISAGPHELGAEMPCQGFHGAALLEIDVPARTGHHAQLMADAGEPVIGVVFTQPQSILRTTGEHPVRFVGSQVDQIVHQDPDVGLVPARPPGGLARHLARRIDTRQQPLRGRLLVAGGPVDLAGKEQTFKGPGLQRVLQIAGIEIVVLDGIAGAGDVGLLEAGDAEQRTTISLSHGTVCRACGGQCESASLHRC